MNKFLSGAFTGAALATGGLVVALLWGAASKRSKTVASITIPDGQHHAYSNVTPFPYTPALFNRT